MGRVVTERGGEGKEVGIWSADPELYMLDSEGLYSVSHTNY